MRIKATEVAEREAFVKEFFKTEPKATVAKANEAVKAKFGKMMRAVRMYQLRDEVNGTVKPVTTETPPVAADAPSVDTEFKS